jgi:hypothetical protein
MLKNRKSMPRCTREKMDKCPKNKNNGYLTPAREKKEKKEDKEIR